MDRPFTPALSKPRAERRFTPRRAKGGSSAASIAYRAVFELLPSGVLLVDRDRSITAANAIARELTGLRGDLRGLTCCEVVGCGAPDTPLAGRCVSAAALEAGDSLPEVRIELELDGATTVSAWLTAAPVGGDSAAVAIGLRPGVVGDRRRRTDPEWRVGPQLRIHVLGRTRLEGADGELGGDWLGHRPGEVLKLLVAERARFLPVDEMLETLWLGRQAASTNVRQAVHTLRDRLEPRRRPHARSPFVVARRGGYELDPGAVWIDADEFERAARAGLVAMQAADLALAEPELSRAVALYVGDFLADEPYAEWAFAERDRLRALARQVLRSLVSLREGEDDHETAGELLRRRAELEPFDVEAQREHLLSLLRRGRYGEAQRRAQVVRSRFQRSFGEDPGLDLHALVAGLAPP